jgi:hypothetical protein
MSVQVYEGIYQIHWCIHGGLDFNWLPLSLTNAASPDIASELAAKALRAKLEKKLELSRAMSWEVEG